jgi:glutamate dehydrogenase/leucine dehydrogenase
LLENFAVVRDVAQARGISYRTASYMVAIDRVVKSMKVRGVYA